MDQAHAQLKPRPFLRYINLTEVIRSIANYYQFAMAYVLGKSYRSYMELHPANRLPEWAEKKRSYLNAFLEDQGEARPPWLFQWMIKRQLALMAWPQYPEHLRFLLRIGIRRLVTTCTECRPPIYKFTEFHWIEIPIPELTAPTQEQIKIFICFAESARQVDESLGIHDRDGRGTAGTLAACYLVRFCGLTAEMAILQLRKSRPYVINTLEQEKAVHVYYQYLCTCPPDDACWNPTGHK